MKETLTGSAVHEALENTERLATTEEGWAALHRDENGDLWELTFPQGHLHGGGPPLLSRISKDEAAQKYPNHNA